MKGKEIIGQACCNGVNMGLHFLSKCYPIFFKLRKREREREREMKTNYMRKLQFHFIQKHIPSISFFEAHICTNIHNKQSTYVRQLVI